jgi:hypothetical protein
MPSLNPDTCGWFNTKTIWKLHNTRIRDIELLEEIGFIPQESFPVSRK